MTTTSTRSLFDQELARLRDDLVQLGSMVETAIGRAVQALRERDAEAARQIMADDQAINHLRYQIEEAAVVMLATQQPMAGDLRTIIAITHAAVELERMGDHAAGIAELVTRMANEPLLKPLIDIPRMAEIDQEMIHAVLEAFVRRDAELARAIAQRDNEVDQLYDQVFRELLTYMLQDPRNIQRATYLLWVAHNLERIGDRITNISERVVFMATGELRELNP